MKTKFFFFLAMLLMSSMGAFAQSETKTPLKGDLNEDGEVNAADITVLVDIIMKKDVDPNKYYWYIGTENPTSISNLQTDNTKPGWHEIGETIEGFVFDTNQQANQVILYSTNTKAYYYVVIPSNLHIYAADGITNVETTYFESATCNINGYKAYHFTISPGARVVRGIIIKENASSEPETQTDNKFYWYIGTENPSSISNIETDNTKPGWHEIGTTLEGFVLDTNRNLIVISDTDRKPFYVVIPDDLHIYNAVNMNVEETSLIPQSCSISGYKAFKNKPSQLFDGVWDVSGLILKQ